MNRGSPHVHGRRVDSPEASMRPRFMNRGSDQAASGTGQRRLGFNEAPIHESGK